MTKKKVQTKLAVIETENTITVGAATWDSNFRDRINYERQKVLTQTITAWRSNPIARRIIELTTEFVVGDGWSFTANKKAEKILSEFWNHPLNNIDEQLPEWADEAWRTGDLFLLISLDEGGKAYVRALPSEAVGVIETKDNDYRQETAYKRDTMDESPWLAYDPSQEQKAFILHFPLSRAVGANFGESDLSHLIYWIGLYRQWLEDRARLNYFRQLFSFVLTRPFTDQAEKNAYMKDFANKMPKKSGGVLGLDPTEKLEALKPELSSNDAEADGMAIKKMIAAGAGIPMHYLAEPESSTRTTAEAAGTPTFKRFKRRQQYLINVVKTLLLTVLQVSKEKTETEIKVNVPDITERDNANLAIAVQRVVTAFAPIYNAKLITPQEFIRLVYRFVAEPLPVNIGEFVPVNIRGGNGGTKLPNTDPSDPKKDDTDA